MDVLVKWWFIVWTSIIGAAVAQNYDLFVRLWEVDKTKLSYVILVLFIFVTALIGSMAKMSRDESNHQQIRERLPLYWFSTDMMNSLGMIGTVAGFIIMLSSAFGSNLNVSDIESIKQLITSTAIGLSTAATTTLVGLICSSIAKLQLVLLERVVTNVEEE